MLELVMPEDQAEAAKVMMPLAIDRSGKTLSSRLNPEQLAAYQAAMASVGLPAEIGRASCRERVCQYVEISVVAVSLKHNKTKPGQTTYNKRLHKSKH